MTSLRTPCQCNGYCGNCIASYFAQNMKFIKNSICMECDTTEELWFCLECGHVGCSRLRRSHALQHYKVTRHARVFDIKKLRIWNYDLQRYEDPNLKDVKPPINITWNLPSHLNPPLNPDCQCPVCRHHEIPKLSKDPICMSCNCTNNLWLCLNCGHIGCSRDLNGHAATHYNATRHRYVMHTHVFSIWDYKQDKYVHRMFGDNERDLNNRIKTEYEADVAERMRRLENEWKNFCQLKETNQKMMSIEQRLTTLSEDKKLLEAKLREHDAKLSELLNQFKCDRRESRPAVGTRNPICKNNNMDSKNMPSHVLNISNSSSLSLSNVSENSNQSQGVLYIIFLLFLYHFIHLLLQSIVAGVCKNM